LLAEPVSGVHAAEAKRKLVTLEDVRRDYSAELDRRSDMLQGRFPVIGGGGDDHVMDVL
jgi:nuclear pore complex protein Nup160